MEGQAGQGTAAVAQSAQRLIDHRSDRRRRSGASRRVAAVAVFALAYLLIFPVLLLSCTAVLAYGTLHWLAFSVLLAPVLGALGLWGLLSGLPLIGLLAGAIAMRWPTRTWPMLLAALLSTTVELLLVRRHGVSWLGARMLPLLIGHGAMLVLGTIVPALSSGLAVLLVPRRLIRRLLAMPPADPGQCPRR